MVEGYIGQLVGNKVCKVEREITKYPHSYESVHDLSLSLKWISVPRPKLDHSQLTSTERSWRHNKKNMKHISCRHASLGFFFLSIDAITRVIRFQRRFK